MPLRPRRYFWEPIPILTVPYQALLREMATLAAEAATSHGSRPIKARVPAPSNPPLNAEGSAGFNSDELWHVSDAPCPSPHIRIVAMYIFTC